MHRLHGKKLPGNSLGLITSENITDTDGLLDRAWNPLDEYIYDVSGDWIDQKCTCSREWQYDSQPIVPTCPKVWFPWEGQTGEGWPITHNKYANDTERFTIHQKQILTMMKKIQNQRRKMTKKMSKRGICFAIARTRQCEGKDVYMCTVAPKAKICCCSKMCRAPRILKWLQPEKWNCIMCSSFFYSKESITR